MKYKVSIGYFLDMTNTLEKVCGNLSIEAAMAVCEGLNNAAVAPVFYLVTEDNEAMSADMYAELADLI